MSLKSCLLSYSIDCVCVYACRSLFWLCFVLCYVMGCVLQFGEIAHERVHHYYHLLCVYQNIYTHICLECIWDEIYLQNKGWLSGVCRGVCKSICLILNQNNPVLWLLTEGNDWSCGFQKKADEKPPTLPTVKEKETPMSDHDPKNLSGCTVS